MALRVWLPLNGNLNNQGISNVQVTNTGATINNNGKIGKAYEFGPSHWLRLEKYAAEFLTYKEFSLSVWFKCTAHNTSHGGSALISAGNWNQPSNLLNLGLSEWSTDHYTRLIISGSGTWSAGYDYNFNLNTWYHVVLTSGNGKMRAYVNGELIGDTYNAFTPNTLEQDWVCIGNGTYYSGFIFNGLMNDVRVYDECLSQKQIKEISKGLVAHYKLDGPKANENLILRSDKITGSSQASGITCTSMSDNSYKIVAASGNGNWCRLSFAEDSNTNVGNKLSVGDTYTISCDIKVEEGTVFPTLFINNGNGYKQLGGPTLKLNTWQRVYYTSTWNEPGTSYGNIALHLGFSSAIGTYYFKNFKLEKGNFTPWIPAPTDNLYTSLGYANDICTDVSGNGYTATKSGTLTFNSDSPRYEGSTTFTSGLVNSPACAVLANSKDFSINGWFYRTGGATITYYASAENYNTSVDLEGSRYFVYGSNGTAYVGNWTSTANTWQMITLVHNSVAKTLSLYVNGNYISQVATSGDVYANNTLNIGGRQGSANFAGSISDFRIYATALSADEILTMYKNSGIIDNKGNVYAYEFKEE